MDSRPRDSRLAALALTCLALSAIATPARAQLCFSTPVALPGLSGAPDWKAPGTVRNELNEPRWAGAPQTGFESDPTGAQGLYRLMVDAAGTEISISFQAPTDPGSMASNADAVYFGFTTDGTIGSLAKGISIRMPTSGINPIEIDPTSPFVQGYAFDGSWSTAAPDWLVEPHAWLTDDETAPEAAWGINFKVDIATAGIDTAMPFKLQLAMHKRDERNNTPPFDGISIWTPDPGLATLHADTLFIANPANWATTTAINTGCTDGVSITGYQIGTRHVDASDTPSPGIVKRASGSTTYFFAAPTLPASVPMVAGMIEGRFYAANWDSVAASNAPWIPLNTSFVANGVPTADPPPTAVTPAPGIGTIEFQCPANTATEICGGITSRVEQQCVYVELRATAGQNVPFRQAAAYRCFDLITEPDPDPSDAGLDASDADVGSDAGEVDGSSVSDAGASDANVRRDAGQDGGEETGHADAMQPAAGAPAAGQGSTEGGAGMRDAPSDTDSSPIANQERGCGCRLFDVAERRSTPPTAALGVWLAIWVLRTRSHRRTQRPAAEASGQRAS